MAPRRVNRRVVPGVFIVVAIAVLAGLALTGLVAPLLPGRPVLIALVAGSAAGLIVVGGAVGWRRTGTSRTRGARVARPGVGEPARSATRLLDRTIAAVLLLVGLPVLLLVALAVKLTSPGPVLARQRRIGDRGREFDLLRFRCTAGLGRALRLSAVDEIPQLVNVLRGEMSLVDRRQT